MKTHGLNADRATGSFAGWALAAGALALFLSVLALTTYLDYINEDYLAKAIQIAILQLGCLLLWVGMWIVLGSAFGGSGKWSTHFCVAALAGAALLLLDELILPMAAFALGWRVGGWLSDALIVCALGLILTAHLRVNHGALSRLTLLSVVSLTVAVGAGGFVYSWAAVELKPERMPYSTRVEPGVTAIIEGQSIDTALTAVTRLSATTDRRVKTLRD